MLYAKSPQKNYKNEIRKIYEPECGRRLTDEEVIEIEDTFKAYARLIIEIGQQIEGKKLNIACE